MAERKGMNGRNEQRRNMITFKKRFGPREEYGLMARRRGLEMMLCARKPRADEDPSLDGYAMRLQRRRELAFWLSEREFDWMVTINPNDPRFDHKRGRTALKKFGALTDRYFLGKRWCRFKPSARTFFFAVPEHSGGELHYHLLLKLPTKAFRDSTRIRRFIRTLNGKLQSKRIVPRGDAHVLRLSGRGEIQDSLKQRDTVCYVAKGLWRSDDYDNCVLSTEFHPSPQAKTV
jgi:hypothetical protein